MLRIINTKTSQIATHSSLLSATKACISPNYFAKQSIPANIHLARTGLVPRCLLYRSFSSSPDPKDSNQKNNTQPNLMEKNEWLIPLLRKVFGYESKTATRIKSMEKVYQQIVAQSERDEFYDVLVRLRAEGKEGNKIGQYLFNQFWKDVENRMIGTGITNPIILSKENKRYAKFYWGSVLSYDEGLKEGDAFLADALWRNVFAMGEEGNPLTITKLSKLVKYVHRELSTLDKDNGSVLEGSVAWGPLDHTVIPGLKK